MSLWIDRVRNYFDNPPTLAPGDDRPDYLNAIFGAALLDAIGATDAILSGITVIPTKDAGSDISHYMFSALLAAGKRVAWSGIDDGGADVCICGANSTGRVVSAWHACPAVLVIDPPSSIAPVLLSIADRKLLLHAPTYVSVFAAAWAAVAGVDRQFDLVETPLDFLDREDIRMILRRGIPDAVAFRRLKIISRRKANDQRKSGDDAGKKRLDNLKAKDDDKQDDPPAPPAPDPVQIGVVANDIVQKLSQMPGFGTVARDWGMRLASDLRDYASGAISWQDVDCGVLLSGPPGCGKTTFARAVALESGVQFVSTSYSDWEGGSSGSYVVKAMKKAFDKWRDMSKSGPLIVFFDEIDSLGARGSNGHNDSYWAPVINALLDFADGAQPRDGIVMLGATNFVDRVDPALRRPGRFDRHIELPAPGIDDLRNIIRHHMDVDDVHAARACRGLSPADIAQACRDARRTARRSRRPVTPADLIAVVDSRRPVRPASELHRIALHESGHALACLHLGIPLQYVDLDNMHTLHGYPGFMPASTILDLITMALAGRAAEDVRTDNPSIGAIADLAWATELARKYHTSFGFGASGLVSTDDAPWRFDSDVRKTLDDCYARAKSILIDHRDELTALTKALETRRYLDADEVRAAIKYDDTAELLALIREDR